MGTENQGGRECPSCFAALAEGEETCPNCGKDLSAAAITAEQEEAQRERAARAFKRFRLLCQAILVAVIVVSTTLGWYLGNWKLALVGFFSSLVFTVLSLFCINLYGWYRWVRPYESGTAARRVPDSEQDGGDGDKR